MLSIIRININLLSHTPAEAQRRRIADTERGRSKDGDNEPTASDRATTAASDDTLTVLLQQFNQNESL